MAVSYGGGTNFLRWGTGFQFATGCCAFWMKTTQATVNAVPLSIWTTSSRTGFGFILNNTANKMTVQCYAGTSTPAVNLLSASTVNNGAWRHIAFNWNTANASANTLFIDGVQDATVNATAAWSISNTIAQPWTGDNNDTFWPSYVGELAGIGIWGNRQLDAAEAAALAKGFSPRLIAPTALTFHTPLVRSPNNLKDSFIGGQSGITFTDHPRVIGGAIAA